MDSLVAAAIHDAKNALSVLNAWLAEAKRECACPALDHAQNAAERVSGQLVELLTLFRAEQGNLRLSIDDHDLTDFLTDVIAELGPPPPGLSLTKDFATAMTLGAWAFDAYQVKFVLLDALRNALRHARSGVRLTFAIEPGGGIRFSVADDGAGFPDEVLAGSATAVTSESTGLGLYFARLVAARHATPDGRGGRVELANAGGAVFSLILP